MENEITISGLLLEHLIELQRITGQKKTWKDLANAIGMDSVYLNKIYNKRRRAGPKIIDLPVFLFP